MSSLIVALDFDSQVDALRLVDKLDPNKCAVKVGSEMFTLYGASWVKQLMQRNFKVFLDLKFHDIPTTVARVCCVCADLGVWMMNVHASGGLKMMEAARVAIEPWGDSRPLLIAVTVLTSFSADDLLSIGVKNDLSTHVTNLAALAKQANLDGVVSSAHDVRSIKQECGDSFVTVTPGVRLENSPLNDQVRVVTPKEVHRLGSDYFVVGRPITQAKDPNSVIDLLLMAQDDAV